MFTLLGEEVHHIPEPVMDSMAEAGDWLAVKLTRTGEVIDEIPVPSFL
jgi:hypothetical protein